MLPASTIHPAGTFHLNGASPRKREKEAVHLIDARFLVVGAVDSQAGRAGRGQPGLVRRLHRIGHGARVPRLPLPGLRPREPCPAMHDAPYSAIRATLSSALSGSASPFLMLA